MEELESATAREDAETARGDDVEVARDAGQLVRLSVGVDLSGTNKDERCSTDLLLQLLVRELCHLVKDKVDHGAVGMFQPFHSVFDALDRTAADRHLEAVIHVKTNG